MFRKLLPMLPAMAAIFLFPIASQALPPPPALADLCQGSDWIVKGAYVGGMVGEVVDCQFWVTFQVKPEKLYKKPAGGEDLKLIQFRKRYFEDTKACANVPGPNAMPGQMAEDLKKPKHEKKIFFLKDSEGSIEDLGDAFWGIVDWNQAPGQWHKEFKETPACQAAN